MNTEEQRDKIIEELEGLNKKIDRQISIKFIFGTGIIYGIGFFIGSVIIATIALGILGPFLGKIQWVQSSFETGSSILHK